MEFLALIHSDEAEWERMGDEERASAYEQYVEFGQAARAAGVFVDGNELGPTASATTVRIRDGNQLVTDGPYAEVKEALVAARVDELAKPTLAAGEDIGTLRAEEFDPEEAARRGMGFERLDQLALEHLYGVRG